MGITLSIDKCPHGTYAISVNDDSGGTRLTNGKCCGRWSTVKQWPMTAEQLRAAANTILEYAEQAEHGG